MSFKTGIIVGVLGTVAGHVKCVQGHKNFPGLIKFNRQYQRINENTSLL